jgi:hypothetical protein
MPCRVAEVMPCRVAEVPGELQQRDAGAAVATLLDHVGDHDRVLISEMLISSGQLRLVLRP